MSTELLKTSNSTLKRKQFCTPREENSENVLLTRQMQTRGYTNGSLFDLQTMEIVCLFVQGWDPSCA